MNFMYNQQKLKLLAFMNLFSESQKIFWVYKKLCFENAGRTFKFMIHTILLQLIFILLYDVDNIYKQCPKLYNIFRIPYLYFMKFLRGF